MKRTIVRLTACIVTTLVISRAQAALTTIGTIDFDSNQDGDANVFGLNLIWDDDNNGNSLVWLDYSNAPTNWSVQRSWAETLEPRLSNISTPGYSISWTDSEWRLPTAGPNPQVAYDQVTAEMGHLFYVELGFQSFPDRGMTFLSSAELNATNFDRLTNGDYWALEARNSRVAWHFDNSLGELNVDDRQFDANYGIAVRGAQVSVIPVPAAIWFLGSGLIALIGIAGRKKLLKPIHV